MPCVEVALPGSGESGRLIGGAIPCKSTPVPVLKFRFHLMP